MYKMKKFVSLLLCICTVLTCLLTFASCKDEDGDGDGEEVTGFSIKDYTLVRSDSASDDLVTATIALQNRLITNTGTTLSISDDWYEEGEDVNSKKEILIGDTNRTETADAKAKLDEINNDKAFVIEVSGNKIVILGKSDEITIRAIKYFAVNFVSTSEHEGTITIDPNYSKANKADTSSVIYPENLVEFSYSKKYTVYGGETPYDSRTLSYPKMIQLQHQSNENNNGILFATLNAAEDYYPILKSTDDGETWSEITRVYDTINGISGIWGGRMPYLYEMPVDMGEFKKGDLILAGTSSDGNTGTANITTITFYASKDLGKTWTTLYNIDYGGAQFYPANVQVDLGVWEPFLMYDNGRIYCFYSDDSDPNHDQKLVYKYTTDMKNWVGKDGIVGKNGADGDPFEIVCCEDKDYRPGMISLVKMNNGEYLAVYDIVVYAPGRPNGQIKVDGKTYTHSPDLYKKSTALDKWDIADPGTVAQLEDGRYMGLSPWVTYSPTISEAGMLVLYGRTWASSDKSQTDLFISFDYGETFITLENPFTYSVDGGTGPNGRKNNCGYSPALFFSADGKTLYFATNVANKYGNGYAIDLVKIEISY